MIALTVVLIASAIAAATDIKTRRIPNAIPACLALAGLALHATQGWQSASISIALLISVFFLGTILFTLKLIGGGDVKFLAAAAATLGWPTTMPFLLYTILAGGVLAILFALLRGRLRLTLSNVAFMTASTLAGARPSRAVSASGTMPYAVAIFAGACTLALATLFRFRGLI